MSESKVVFIEMNPVGTVFFHPPGEYVTGDGDRIPYQKNAKEMLAAIASGATVFLPSLCDEFGKKVWSIKTFPIQLSESAIRQRQQEILDQLKGTGVTPVFLPPGARVVTPDGQVAEQIKATENQPEQCHFTGQLVDLITHRPREKHPNVAGTDPVETGE